MILEDGTLSQQLIHFFLELHCFLAMLHVLYDCSCDSAGMCSKGFV